MKTILLVEDDKSLGQELKIELSDNQFNVIWVENLASAQASFDEKKPDIIVLDWNLPDGEGLTWLIHLRQRQEILPVIMLTARSDLHYKVSGLQMGANDYLTKPFEILELLARIQVQLKTTVENYEDTDWIVVGDIELKRDDRTLKVGNKESRLSPLEYDFLVFLMQRKEKVFSRAELIEKVWKNDPNCETRAVDNLVAGLRKKLNRTRIETIRGLGYRLTSKGE